MNPPCMSIHSTSSASSIIPASAAAPASKLPQSFVLLARSAPAVPRSEVLFVPPKGSTSTAAAPRSTSALLVVLCGHYTTTLVPQSSTSTNITTSIPSTSRACDALRSRISRAAAAVAVGREKVRFIDPLRFFSSVLSVKGEGARAFPHVSFDPFFPCLDRPHIRVRSGDLGSWFFSLREI